MHLFLFFFTLCCYTVLCYASISSHSSKLTGKLIYKDFNNSGACFQKSVCQSVQNLSCFGTPLPYTSTSIDLAEDSESQFEIQDNLAFWQGLKSVPRCWAVIQPLLCAVYMPKCENGSIFLPSQEMCRITRSSCKIVEVEHGWPSFLQCDNKKLFPGRCRNPLQEIKFNISYKCMPPLVETDNPDNWFHEVEGCGIQCQNPLYSEKEHTAVHNFISALAIVSCVITMFTVLTFLINWKGTNKNPDRMIFYINLCWAIVSLGFITQSLGARDQIVCGSDGTLRRGQPGSGHLYCSFTFVLIYSFLMAAIAWFVFLTYAWYVQYHGKRVPKHIGKKFHMGAWFTPLILTVIVMSLSQVEGDSMSGICFVGFSDIYIRIIFVLCPVGVASLLGGYFLSLFLYNLVKVKLNSEEVTNEHARKKICYMIKKTGFFSFCFVLLICITFACHAYDFMNRHEWNESLKDYIVCLAMHSAQSTSNVGDSTESISKCSLKSKPNINFLYLHLSCPLIFGVMVSTLVWNRATLETWKAKFYSICAPTEKNDNALKKHQLIAKAFQKRHEINKGNNFSFTSVHEDPLGLNMNLNSVASQEMSSSWAMALPNFMMRRNAAIGPFLPRQYSSASDVSRHISMDSFNQPNLDSLSMQISERDYHEQAWRQRRKTRKERERFVRANRIAPWFPGNRRGSDTSLQSSLLSASMAVAASRNANIAAQVTKSTSTGDLGAQSPITDAALITSVVLPRPRHRNLIQQAALNPPPFTHGMTDNSHRIECRNLPSAIGSSVGQRYTPIPMTSSMQTPFPGIIRSSLYGHTYDIMNTIPTGYIGGMYPSMNGMYPRYPTASNFAFPTYNMPYFTYAAYQSMDAMASQPSLIPLHPRADSASETEYLPIIMSDSEFTDTGVRSHDESYVLTTQRLIQERLQAQLLAKAEKEVSAQVKPVLESQATAKSQLLKRMKTNNTAAQTSRPNSGRKSHNSAPPPSPADSLNNLNSEINMDSVNSDSHGTSAFVSINESPD